MRQHGHELREIDRELSQIHDELARVADTDPLSQTELAEAVRSLEETLNLRSYDLDPDGAETIEHTTELRPVIDAVVKRVTVLPDRSLEITMHEGPDQQIRLQRLLRTLAEKEIEYVRNMRWAR